MRPSPLVRIRRNPPGRAALAASVAFLHVAPVAVRAERPDTRPAPARIELLLEAMTLEEKIGQLNQQGGGPIRDDDPAVRERKQAEFEQLIRDGKIGALLGAHGAEYTNRLQRIAVEESRQRIPLLLGNDVIHGYMTITPIPLAEACTWDPELIERGAAMAAREARAGGTHWTFAPMVDIARDPRWGRVAEGAGEDPYLGSVIAAARVRGFQGTDPASEDRVLACAKHFAAYGGAEGGRDYNSVDVSERTLREVFLPPFRAAVDAGAASLMSAFNDISGIPASANPLILRRILRQEWGFQGFVVSDWNSVGELVPHGYAADSCDAARKGLLAGVDLDMQSFTYRDCLQQEVESGRVPLAALDAAVRRVLEAKQKAGLFQRPYTDPARAAEVNLTPEHRALAREIARGSIVLLKNEGDLLPIRPEVKTLAVIGPLADDAKNPFGTWAGIGNSGEVVTALQGVRDRAGSEMSIRHARGCALDGDDRTGFVEAEEAARGADLALLFVGEAENQSGEAHCRSSLDLTGVQAELIEAVRRTGTPVVVVLMTGRPLALERLAQSAPAVVQAWHLGTENGHAIADVLFGDFNPAGRLPITFPRNVGQVPLYYAHRNTGRPPKKDDRYTSKYLDVDWTPLFPFGYGLSYTRFEYGELELAPNEVRKGDTVTVRAKVTNAGTRAGHEVVQLYVRDPVASVTQPVRRLFGFERVFLQPGESRSVTFQVRPQQLGFYDAATQYVVEPGEFHVWIGPSSADGLRGAFVLLDDER